MRDNKLLQKGFVKLGIQYEADVLDAFGLYLTELKKWNRAYSLTALRDDRDVVIKHFLDSALYLKVLPPGTASIADVGSGAGFPGVPIKILRPDWGVTLIEPSQKKSAFLRHIIRKLGLSGIEAIEARAEDVSGIKVDAALTRALFPAAKFLKAAGHLVRPGGCLVLSKGPKVREELKGLEVEVSLRTLALPFSEIKRNMLTLKMPTAGQEKEARER